MTELKLWDNNAIESNEVLVFNALVSIGEEVEEVTQTRWESFETNKGEEYRVFNSYEEAECEAIEETIAYFECEGLYEGMIDFAVGEGCIDFDWFEDALCEVYESIAWNEDIEYIVEDWDEETMDEDEERENYYNSMVSSIGDCAEDFFREYLYRFGEKEVLNIVEENNLVNLRELAEAIVSYDGAENTLASYDGNYFVANGLYFFRVN